MIFVCFLLVVSLFLLSAYLCGDAGTFVNLDSVLIVLFGFAVSSIAVSFGRFRVLLGGLRQVFRFKAVPEANAKLRGMLKTIAVMTLATGACSTAQGCISGVLIVSDAYSVGQKLCFASFTLVYSVIFVCFLLLPLINRYSVKNG